MSESVISTSQTTKKVYTTDFLLSFKKNEESNVIPKGAEDFQKMLEKSNLAAGSKSGQQSNNYLRESGGGGGNRGRGGGGGGNRDLRQSTGGGRNRDNKKSQRRDGGGSLRNSSNTNGTICNNTNGVVVSEVVPLVESENRWQRPTPDVDARTKDLRDAQGFLNKITPEKFESLSNKIIGLIAYKEILEGVVAMIYEKAVRESKFCKMYADLCTKLILKLAPIPADGKTISFHSLLMQQCEAEFKKEQSERQSQIDELKDLPEEERVEKLFIIKQKSIGNTKFIGELFKQNIVSAKIVISCITKLMPEDVEDAEDDKDDKDAEDTKDDKDDKDAKDAKDAEDDKDAEDASPINEDDVENLCKLLTTIGSHLEENNKELTESCFERLSRVAKRKSLSSRHRFMIMDLMDLKKEKWVPRRKEYEAKSIKEIHDEVKKTEIQKESALRASSPALSNTPTPPTSGRGGVVRRSADSQFTYRAPVATEPIVPTGPPTRTKIQPIPNKAKPKVDEWQTTSGKKSSSKQASVQSKPAAASKPKPKGATNPFDLLGSGDDGSVTPKKAAKPKQTPAKNASKNAPKNQAPKAVESASASESVEEVASSEPEAEKPKITAEQAKIKLNAIFEEYITSLEAEEAKLCITELNNPEIHPEVVVRGFIAVLEKKDVDRSNMLSLFLKLGKSKTLTSDHFAAGYKEILVLLEELVIDIPHALKYFATFIADTIVAGNMSLSDIETIIPSDSFLITSSKAVQVVADIFDAVLAATDIEQLKKLQQDSEIELNKFLNKDQPQDVIKETFTKKNEKLAELFA